jgi:hypothetical protein
MNENIKLLIMKSGGIICSTVETDTIDKFDYHRHFDADKTIDKIDYLHFDAEKFAELILQDVLTIVDGKNLLPYFDGYVESEPEDPIGKGWWRKQETTKRVIKNHFGVEE